jgi:outer membrane protein
MRKLFVVFAVGFFVSTFSFAQDAEMLDFEKAIQIGLENNFDVKISINNSLLLENDKRIGSSVLMPSVAATNIRNFRKEDTEQRFFNDPAPRTIDGAETTTNNYSLVAIYGFRPEAVVALQRLGKLSEIGELDAKVTIENTVAAISTTYFRLVLELQRYNVLQTTLKLSDQRMEIAKAQYEFGRASKRDFLAAQVDYNADLTALVTQEQVIQNSRVDLNQLLAIDPSKNFAVKDTIIIRENLDLSDLLENAYENNKQFLISQRMQNVAYLQLREIQAERLPFVTLNGSYNNNTLNSDAGFLIQNKVDGMTFGATVGINLFSGFSINRRVQGAKIQMNNQKHILDQFEIQMQSDLQRTYNTYLNSKRLLQIEQKNYEVAIENADIALDRFRLGIANYLEFRDAQVNRLAAESRLIESLYNIKESEIELMRLSGRIYFQNPYEKIY